MNIITEKILNICWKWINRNISYLFYILKNFLDWSLIYNLYFRPIVRLLVRELAHLKMSSSVDLISIWDHQLDQIITVSCIIWIIGHYPMVFLHSLTVKLLWLETDRESENITKTDAKVSTFLCMLLFFHETWT